MSLLLDTCVISEAVKQMPNARVSQWLAAQDDDALHLSVITLGELEKGISRLPESRRRSQLETWLAHDIRARFEGRMLPISLDVALHWGRLQAECASQGRPLPVIDSLLASTALVHNLTLVTRNVEGFAVTGLDVFNPWQE